FTYWYIRPHQLLPAIVPLFPVPNFPSYPSNHSTFSATRSEILAYLFPEHAEFIRGVGKEAGDSRISAGIHYQMDNLAGTELGRSVAQVFINWAEHDGSHCALSHPGGSCRRIALRHRCAVSVGS